MFVTWNKQYGDQWDLRGCIGCFEPLPLSDLARYAVIRWGCALRRPPAPATLTLAAARSATKDHRFDAVGLDEVPELSCGVSLLTDFEDGLGALEWTVGKHGIIIDFAVGGRSMSATFLPQVASEQGERGRRRARGGQALTRVRACRVGQEGDAERAGAQGGLPRPADGRVPGRDQAHTVPVFQVQVHVRRVRAHARRGPAGSAAGQRIGGGQVAARRPGAVCARGRANARARVLR